VIVPWPGWRSRKNGLSRGAKLRSGRAGRRVRRARPIRGETPHTRVVTRKRAVPSDLGKPSSRPPSPASLRASCGQGSARRGKRPRNLRTRSRRWAVKREPTGKQEARESGYGSSRRESSEGRLQGRERHGTRPRSVGASRRTAGSARGSCVPRTQPEPSRGARTLRTAPVGIWRSSPSARGSWARSRKVPQTWSRASDEGHPA
jgi:hypothetical protein